MTLRFIFLALFGLVLNSQADVYAVDQGTPDGVNNQPKWITPEAAEIYLYSIRSPLMKGSYTDHVLSLYYFGDYGERTLMGLERIKGADYQQHFSLLVFNKKKLIGYYPEVLSFPSTVDQQGIVQFPKRFSKKTKHPEWVFSLANDYFYPLCLADEPCVDWVTAEKE